MNFRMGDANDSEILLSYPPESFTLIEFYHYTKVLYTFV